MNIKKINLLICGYGAMGKLITRLLDKASEATLHISVYDPYVDVPDNLKLKDNELDKISHVLLCTQVNNYNDVLEQLQFKSQTIIISLSACMLRAANVLEPYSDNYQLLLSHPLFGPATYAENKQNLKGLKVALAKNNTAEQSYLETKRILNQSGLEIIDTTPEDHDKTMSKHHILPYLLSHVLKHSDFQHTPLLTRSGEKLFEFLNHTSENESTLLEMIKYNPYAKAEIDIFLSKFQELYDK